MAKKVKESGLLLFNLTVPSPQIKQEVYIPLLSCNRCNEVETHMTPNCPHPASFTKCSECSSLEHTFRDCRVQDKKCVNCRGAHSARAMRCPVMREVLEQKEEQLRSQRTQPNTPHQETENEEDRKDTDDTSAETSSDEEGSENDELTIHIIKRDSDDWPQDKTYATLQKGFLDERYKIYHSGTEDAETVARWVKKHKGSLSAYCKSVDLCCPWCNMHYLLQ
ncbi:hypothetical protein O3P69_015315 [Scylla paramamosain]|uniref:Uncharacterized protein n=1 Tax=Scylla paramamosain TaxID=85552 RepID=A0AAW0T687_SCYPA